MLVGISFGLGGVKEATDTPLAGAARGGCSGLPFLS